MKKKFTLLTTLVLSLLMAAPALADQQSLVGIKLNQGGEYVSTATPAANTFYVIQGNAQHDNIVSWLFDNNGTFAATAESEVPTGPEAMKYVWTFEVTDDGYAAKNLVTGSYIYIEGTSSGGSIKMRTEPAYFSIVVGEEDNEGYVAFMNASNQCIDMGYSGVGPVSWAGGATGSRRLTIYEAEVETISDIDAAIDRLNTCYGEYQDFLPDGSSPFDRGSEIGQYNCSDEDYNFFIDNMTLAFKILQEEIDITNYTVEDIDAIIKNIEDGYNAIIASLVRLTIANGNYRIVSAMLWTNTERIATGEYDENDQEIFEEITTNPTKAMYATLEGKAMWANIDSTDCRYLWKMTNNPETGLVQMMNIATDGILATCSQSTQATLAADSQTEMTFEFIQRNEDGKIVVAMKPSTGGDYAFLHCNGHSSGAGVASNIVGWTASAGASNWILEPVCDDEVQKLVDAYAPIKDHELLVNMFNELISETESVIAQAKDEQYITERSEGLITSTDQFSSPWTESSEGSLTNLLSDDASTFWHSAWSGGSVDNHTHYLQVAFTQPIEGDIQCFVRRRNVTNDHVTVLGVFGSNDEAALGKTEDGYEATTEDGWTEIGTYNLPNASSGQTAYSNGIQFPEGGFKYLRFYIDGTTTGRGYGHFATFQLYKLTIDGNTQWSQLGDAATAIEEALAAAKAVDQDEMKDMTEYNALKAALDAFKLLVADPSALAAAINANKDVVNLVAYGENPGFWQEGGEVNVFATTLVNATAYLKSGSYTQEQLDAYTEAITNGARDIFAAANPVEEGKWYAIKFDSEANYDTHGWSKSGAKNETLGDLYNNYAAPANIEEDALVGFSSLEDVTVGQAVRFINEDIVNEMDLVAFRFVAQGDSAFVIQHKSGLYLNGAARSTNLTLGLAPALFNVKAVGYGKVIIEARNLKGQGYYADAPVYLHAQNAGHSLVTWNNDAVDSSSALYIEPIEDGDLDEGTDAQESIVMNVKPNSMIFMCYPTGFSVDNAEIYAYQGAFPDTETEGADLAYYAFNKIEQAEPGQPVLLVVGDPEDFEADGDEEDLEEISFSPLGSSFAPDPLTTGGVHGTYTYEWVDEGTVVVYGNDKKYGKAGNALVLAEGADATDCTRDISANTGYIVYKENILKNVSTDDFDLVISGPKGPGIVGDLNGDTQVNIADAVIVLDIMANSEYNEAADFNGDGEVNIADFVVVLDIMAAQ